MKILFLAHRIPFPPNKGDKIRSFHMLDHLLRRHEVWLATLIDDVADVAAVPALSDRVQRLLHARVDQPARRLWALRGLATGHAITVRYFYSQRLQAQIDELIGTVEFDAVFCSCSPMAEYVFRSRHIDGRLAKMLKIMDLIDVDSYKWQQYADRSPLWIEWIYRHEARQLGAYEGKICRIFDRVLLVTEQEKRYFASPNEHGKLQAVGNGVDLRFFHPAHGRRSAYGGPVLVFTGMMNYWPNVDAMRWFVGDVYPQIRQAVPQVLLFVVGNQPTREVRRWGGRDGIVVTGFVPDVRDYLATADVCIAPLRVARGIQNKVLEAMAMEKAVVSTPQAFEGINAVPGRDLAIAEEKTFASTVTALLRDPAEARRLGTNARRCVECHYSWEANLRILDTILSSV